MPDLGGIIETMWTSGLHKDPSESRHGSPAQPGATYGPAVVRSDAEVFEAEAMPHRSDIYRTALERRGHFLVSWFFVEAEPIDF